MSWQTLSLHFRQKYDGGFRYLDKCGEFMLAAVEEMDFLPTETKPTGAQLEIPEHGLKASVDTFELVATQELPQEDEVFLKTCIGLAGLTDKCFQPTGVIQNGFAGIFYWPIPNVDSLLAASLKFNSDAPIAVGKKLGMVPEHQRLDFNLTSGSVDLHVVLQPVTFENVSIKRQTAKFKSPQTFQRRAERSNKGADRFNVPLSHALMLEVDVTEADPPEDMRSSLQQLFLQMTDYADTLQKEFSVK